MKWVRCALLMIAVAGSSVALAADAALTGASAGADLESLELDLQALERDLALLEEDLLYPPSSKVAVYLSMDTGELFALDAVKVELNGDEVQHHLYTERQVDALRRGAVQSLYVGNATAGENEINAFFIGHGPSGREFKRAATVTFEKGFDPVVVELVIRDSQGHRQPQFEARVH